MISLKHVMREKSKTPSPFNIIPFLLNDSHKLLLFVILWWFLHFWLMILILIKSNHISSRPLSYRWSIFIALLFATNRRTLRIFPHCQNLHLRLWGGDLLLILSEIRNTICIWSEIWIENRIMNVIRGGDSVHLLEGLFSHHILFF